MSLSEFDIIRRYFCRDELAFARDGIELGIGDDAALIRPPANHSLAMTMDVLVEGVHFPVGASPGLLAWRALAVNLSDLAAMGAEPLCFTLGLSLPRGEPAWLDEFSLGLAELASLHRCPLVGGDVTRGPLSITIQAHGLLADGRALRRDGARPGQAILVTGYPGDGLLALASLGLEGVLPDWFDAAAFRCAAEDRDYFRQAFYRPQPRLEFARRALPGLEAGIDISDGLMGDLSHILRASAVGARLNLAQFPLSAPARRSAGEDLLRQAALFGGDDYELCLTAESAEIPRLMEIAQDLQMPLTEIGRVEDEAGLRCVDAHGEVVDFAQSAYLHFPDP